MNIFITLIFIAIFIAITIILVNVFQGITWEFGKKKTTSIPLIVCCAIVSFLLVGMLYFTAIKIFYPDKMKTEEIDKLDKLIYSTAYHLDVGTEILRILDEKVYRTIPGTEFYSEISSDKLSDIAIYSYEPLAVQYDKVYVPSIGFCIVFEQTVEFLFLNLDDSYKVYNGLSGVRVLSEDLRHVVGFVSSVDSGVLRVRLINE